MEDIIHTSLILPNDNNHTITEPPTPPRKNNLKNNKIIIYQTENQKEQVSKDQDIVTRNKIKKET